MGCWLMVIYLYLFQNREIERLARQCVLWETKYDNKVNGSTIANTSLAHPIALSDAFKIF